MTAPTGLDQAERPPVEPKKPFSRAIPLGRWAGVPITAHWTVLATIVLFASVLANSVLRDLLPGRSVTAYWVTGTVTALVFLVTLLAHELAHAIAARRYGMQVKRITLWMLGGFTELEGDAPSPRADAVIAGVGPATSLLLGGAGIGAVWGLHLDGLFGAGVVWLGAANIVLGVFNLLPGAPLDGGRLLRALLWWRYRDRTRAAANSARVGRVLGLLLTAVGFWQILTNHWDGFWLVLVGMFLQAAATGEQAGALLSGLRGRRARELMSPAGAPVPDWWTVEQFDVAAAGQPVGPVLVLVDFPGAASGILSLTDLRRLPAERRGDTRLRDVARMRGTRLLRVAPEAPVEQFLPLLGMRGGVVVVADEAGRPLGLITPADVQRAARSAESARRQARPDGRPSNISIG